MAGLPCPSCGKRSDVIDSRRTHLWRAPAVRRRRECVACGLRWTTFESAMAGPDHDRSIEHLSHSIDSAVTALVMLQNMLNRAP